MSYWMTSNMKETRCRKVLKLSSIFPIIFATSIFIEKLLFSGGFPDTSQGGLLPRNRPERAAPVSVLPVPKQNVNTAKTDSVDVLIRYG